MTHPIHLSHANDPEVATRSLGEIASPAFISRVLTTPWWNSRTLGGVRHHFPLLDTAFNESRFPFTLAMRLDEHKGQL